MRLVVLSTLACAAYATVHPVGIDDTTPGSIASTSLTLPTTSPKGVYGTLFEDVVIPYIGFLPGPMQFRFLLLSNLASYSVAAAFHPTALDHWARVAVSADRRRSAANLSPALFELHKQVTLAYATLFMTRGLSPNPVTDIEDALVSFGLNPSVCDQTDCSNPATPWGFALQLANEALGFASRDGWNADGSLNRDYNKVPYSDWRAEPYAPLNDADHLIDLSRWQPLQLGSNGLLFHQKHITPHIGQTARSIFLGDTDICARQAPPPDYDYDQEMQDALDRGAMLAQSDSMKMMVELFDNKLVSLVPLISQYALRMQMNMDSFEYIVINSVLLNTMYEGLIVVWKEKVRHDSIRPPTLIHARLGTTPVFTYAGAYQGAQMIPADNWEPYIQTMPHSEYPSGSSCVCQATSLAMIDLTGSDDFMTTVGGDLVLDFAAGSSRAEPGVTPATDVQLTFSSWTDVSQKCGESRLDGGMHFSTSVPSAATLCGSIGPTVVQAFRDLTQGTVPAYVADMDAQLPSEKRCEVTGTTPPWGGGTGSGWGYGWMDWNIRNPWH